MICFATREILVHNTLTVITLFTNYKLTTSYSIPLYCKYNKILFGQQQQNKKKTKRVTLFNLCTEKTYSRIQGAAPRALEVTK